MKYEWTWQDDEHLADLFREAERQRAAFEAQHKPKINWGPLVGGLLVMTFFGLFVWGCVDAYIYVTNWIQ